MRIILIVLVFAMLESCYNKNKGGIAYTKTSDTLRFAELFSFSLFQYKELNNKHLLYCLNGKSSELLAYDIDEKKTANRIKVADSVYRNIQLGNVRSFYVHNSDSIFIQHLYCLSMIDSSGRIRSGRIINAPQADDWPAVMYNNLGSVFPLYYDATLKALFTRQYSGEKELWHPDFYSTKVEAEIALNDTGNLELPVGYPSVYLKNYCGEANLAFREVSDSCNIYTFMAAPEVYTYNRYTGDIKHFTAKSSMQTKEFTPLDLKYKDDMNRKVDHLVENPLYMKVIYDKYKGWYYRILLNGKELKNKDGSYNMFSDKDLVISIFDKNFRLINEFNMGSNYLWNYSFVTPKGLYILKNSTTTTINQATINGKNFIFDIFTFNSN
jgi:hypothetical protein